MKIKSIYPVKYTNYFTYEIQEAGIVRFNHISNPDLCFIWYIEYHTISFIFLTESILSTRILDLHPKCKTLLEADLNYVSDLINDFYKNIGCHYVK